MTALPFAVYDVFTETLFTGNPLAVVFDADALSDDAMQTIAREFNLSETVFIRAPADPEHAAYMRIFTPGKELPFAGHPTVGGAIAIAERQLGSATAQDALIVLEEKIGLVRCAVKIASNRASFAEFDAPKLSEEAPVAATDEAIAKALGVDASDIGFDRHIPTIYSAGVPFVFAPVASLDVLARVRPTPAAASAALGVGELYVYARTADEATHAFRARMFAPEFGVPEDPATGGAAAAFAGVLARFENLADGRHTLPILQGVEMGRPSLIGLEIELAGGSLANVRIGGNAVKVSEGTLSV